MFYSYTFIILKADNHRVDEANPSAVALGYRHDAASVDTAKYPARATPAGENNSVTTASCTRPVMTAGAIAAYSRASRSMEKAGVVPGLPVELKQVSGCVNGETGRLLPLPKEDRNMFKKADFFSWRR